MYLKKIFEMMGLSILICFSFVLTEKTAKIFKNEDKIMMTIKENSPDLEIESILFKIELKKCYLELKFVIVT